MASDHGKCTLNVERLKPGFFVVFMIGALFFALSCERHGRTVPGSAGPLDFTLQDISGGKVTLSSLKGKVVLVEFWATWCPPCRDSVPEMNALHKKYLDKNFELLAVSLDRGGDVASAVSSFVRENGILYRVLLDDDKTSSAFGVANIPVIFIMDKQGKVAKKHIGFAPGLSENLSREIEDLL